MESRRNPLNAERDPQRPSAHKLDRKDASPKPPAVHAYTELLQRLAIQILHFNDDGDYTGGEK